MQMNQEDALRKVENAIPTLVRASLILRDRRRPLTLFSAFRASFLAPLLSFAE